VERVRAALRTGAFVALCGKNALAAQAAGWLQGATRGRFGVDASFGGAGAQLLRELDELRARAEALAVVGNVTTTVVIETIERGGSLDDGLAAARSRGLLESDPTCDLDGSDAACKLVAVFGAVFGESYLRTPALADVARADLRTLAPELLRERHARGATTRLVGRADRAGSLRVAFEEVPIGSPLAAPADRVVYGYRLPEGLRVHVGAAVGADRTAEALCGDVLRAVRAEVRS
jgi:homoserine dehydrogenase